MNYPHKENYSEKDWEADNANFKNEVEVAKNRPVEYIQTTYASIDNGYHEDSLGIWDPSLWFAKENNNDELEKNIFLSGECSVDYIKTQTEIFLSDEDLVDFIKLDVNIDAFSKFRDIKNKAKKICAFLPDYIIGEGILASIEAKTIDLLAASSFARKNTDKPDDRSNLFSEEDIKRAFRDFDFLLDSIYMALGGYIDWQKDLWGNRTFCKVLKGRKHSNGGYESSYEVTTTTEFDEGDFIETPDDEKDNWDLYLYKGILNIQIDPTKRVAFEYIPDQQSARNYHETKTVIKHKTGEQLKYDNKGLSLRIDIDKTAPCGIALDIGRSPYDAAKSEGAFTRTGDLLGTIFAEVSPNGCHEYTGFTSEMRDNFKGFAEELALNQYLRLA